MRSKRIEWFCVLAVLVGSAAAMPTLELAKPRPAPQLTIDWWKWGCWFIGLDCEVKPIPPKPFVPPPDVPHCDPTDYGPC